MIEGVVGSGLFLLICGMKWLGKEPRSRSNKWVSLKIVSLEVGGFDFHLNPYIKNCIQREPIFLAIFIVLELKSLIMGHFLGLGASSVTSPPRDQICKYAVQ